VEHLNGKKRPLSLVQGRMLIACLDIGEKVNIGIYNHYIYIYKYYIQKKKRKWSGMSGQACSSLGMMSTMAAKAVACIDQLWQMVIGQLSGWEQWWKAVPHIPGPMLMWA
jgi:hypothetical protein